MEKMKQNPKGEIESNIAQNIYDTNLQLLSLYAQALGFNFDKINDDELSLNDKAIKETEKIIEQLLEYLNHPFLENADIIKLINDNVKSIRDDVEVLKASLGESAYQEINRRNEGAYLNTANSTEESINAHLESRRIKNSDIDIAKVEFNSLEAPQEFS
ncbi:UNVERIFIED_CONTAM: hypothetical protein O8I53_11690 [Campylobacter lari]